MERNAMPFNDQKYGRVNVSLNSLPPDKKRKVIALGFHSIVGCWTGPSCDINLVDAHAIERAVQSYANSHEDDVLNSDMEFYGLTEEDIAHYNDRYERGAL
jgi:hypothetical protein